MRTVTVVGCGYVGLPTGAGLAEFGNQVICVDKDMDRIKILNEGQVPIFEPGLKELIKKNVVEGRLSFSTNLGEAVRKSAVIIIAVGTPPKPKTNEADLKYVLRVAREIGQHLKSKQVIAIKSTVPVGTGDKVENIILKNGKRNYVVSLPEFLREGKAVEDFLYPDRVVIGADDQYAANIVRSLFPFSYHEGVFQILEMPRRCSELVKYASNSFLATKIEFVNEMANLCEKVGADIRHVSRGMGRDSRIGPDFLAAGPGYGGSCFPKDTMALAFQASKRRLDLPVLNAVIKGNDGRIDGLIGRIKKILKQIRRPRVAVAGLAFKADTDDCRVSPAIKLVKALVKEGIKVSVHDPKAMVNAWKILRSTVDYYNSVPLAAQDSDMLIIATEWPEFRYIDLKILSNVMRHKIIFDLRNIISDEVVEKTDFKLFRIGV